MTKIIVDTKFQNKLTTLPIKFAHKVCFWFKTEKVNIAIELHMFQLV